MRPDFDWMLWAPENVMGVTNTTYWATGSPVTAPVEAGFRRKFDVKSQRIFREPLDKLWLYIQPTDGSITSANAVASVLVKTR